ncbi:hypothetical protein [Phycicoccus duodecadis]|uniref:Uncharacterized protein n=1 Tax=Phycicoccus duodecadis TaxID=173053 RepID=A0A2N3YF58_9MICO|nr:hypothetical protein [Phycicoccus duodecadis]PKW25456.1 hypothetical protein ATL31_0246 [Phycicoccus duodecadis]
MSTRSRVIQVVAATSAVGVLPVALAVVHLPRPDGPTTQSPAASAATVGTASATTRWVALDTGAGPSITLNGPTGRIGATQTLAEATDCGMDQGAVSSRYLSFSGSTARTYSETLASFASGSIGVKEKKSGVSCYQANSPSESLKVSLGAGLRTALGPDVVASAAFLDVELKQGAQIMATAKLKGAVTGVFELRSGSSITSPAPLPGGVTATAVTTCTTSADSGPDAGVGDNCRWPVSMPSWLGPDDGIVFDELTLTAVGGSFSLEGGGDGQVEPQSPLSTPNASIVQVADGVLDCGASTRTIAASADAPQVSVYRLGNADASACVPVPYSLGTAPAYAQFLKPLDSQTTAQFLWDLTWRFPETAGTTALPDLKVDYEYPAPGDTVTLGWCPDPSFDTAGRFAGYPAGSLTAAMDQEPDLPGTQFACVVSRSARPVDGDPDTVGSRDVVYVYGDAGMRY